MILRKDFQRNQTSEKQTENRMGNHTIKKKRYNPFLDDYKRDDFDDYCYSILEMMISKSAEVFECLPIIENAPLMRNILYSGVWLKYEIKRNKKAEDKK